MSAGAHSDLRAAIRETHGCDSTWMRTAHVVEMYEGRDVWNGAVEIFALHGHPKAQECYAWSYPVDGSTKVGYVAVLRLPPVGSPGDAVRAYVVEQFRTGKLK